MIKAFFSYSTQDAGFVREVASRIGRPFVTIDHQSFSSGADILSSIDDALRESALFVLFLTKESLASPWVTHETQEARFHAAMGRLKNSLVVCLDQRITADDLPEWLRRSKYMAATAAPPVVRRINGLLDDLVRQSQSTLFVGRSNEIAELQDAYTTPGPSSSAQVVCVTGLTGIGKKSALTKMVRESLGLERLVVIDIEPGDTVQNLAVKLSAQVDPPETPERSLARVHEIAALHDQEARSLVLAKFAEIARYREMPVLNDAGGLLDNDGNIAAYVLDVIESLSKHPDILAALLTNRRPAREPLVIRGVSLPVIQLHELSDSEISRLVALMAKSRGMEIRNDTVRKVTSAVRGYPPSVTYALELVKAYGPDLWERNRLLSDFNAAPFVRYLRDNLVSAVERKILRIVGANSPLPLPVLQEVLKASEEEIVTALVHLIDLSLIVPTDAGWYEVAGPATGAIGREYGACDTSEYAAVASRLDRFLSTSENEADYLSLQRTLFRAFSLAGKESTRRAYAIAADWVKLAEQYYHQTHDYERAAETARVVVSSHPDLHQARTLLIQSLVKLSEYDEAQEHIAEFKRRSQVRDAFYLLGFLERHRGDHRQALGHYDKALAHGRGGMAIHRDMADCYLRLRDLDKANEHISIAQEKQPDNKFLVDLKIQIACLRRDRETARRLLFRLADIESDIYVCHRTSRVEYAFGSYESAYEFAKMAVEKSAHPPFEVLANYAWCAILTSRRAEAEATLDRLDRSYKQQKHDIRAGLRARLAIMAQDYERALDYAGTFRNPGRPVHLSIKRDALRGLVESVTMSGSRLVELGEEVKRLEDRLSGEEADFDLDS
ncbi:MULTISPECIES: toll/interleukin-1 receptor domain-containing protein [unclassified Streptomyces]|uniref:toll/interleukin-1 receptor domain-containing protein n=1 Tax=unclassified Streptomyces TaxID=2593676 RepID=UPI0006AECAE6|nr:MULTISPECIES: toll/interleukin-1 receptor domain-containing protein [unclassified Streptomyces]KOX38594.1 hypothetical protein ADL06_00905 [Streptomyces sp. NRRL F-6491]KOX52583.1 hypothetical protein ADL08_00265 [Streptomyces sp. NRRL F-6492]